MRRTAGIALALVLFLAPAAAASDYVIHGRGYGHGIGLSQWGAHGFAKHGRDYRWILAHYYRGTTLGYAPGETIRVLLESAQPAVSFSGATAAGSAKLRPQVTYTARLRLDGRIALSGGRGAARELPAPLRVSSSGGAVRLAGRAQNGVVDGAYRGALELSSSGFGGLLTAVNAVDIEGYLKGVVPSEVPARWPAETLKAQAVAARSYALASAGGVLFPDTRSQMYRGLDGEAVRSSGAVDATAGQVVRYRGRIATTYFFSTSGGRTEKVENVFYGSAPEPYLGSVSDPFERTAPRHTWVVRLTTAQVQARLGALVKGAFRGIRVVRRGASPRVVWAEVVGTGGVTRVRGATLEARLGLYDTWAFFPPLPPSRRAHAATPPRAAPSAPAAHRPGGKAPGFRWPAQTWEERTG